MTSATRRLPASPYPMATGGTRPRRRDRWIARAVTLFELTALTVLTLGIGYWSGALRGFPVGNDALGHLSKVRQILDAWPHFNWNDAWYAGLPNFTGSYPPGYHLLVVVIAKYAGANATTAMLVVTGLSLVLLTLGSYGFVRLAARSRVLAWLAALAVLAEPTLWSQSLQFGLYPRLLSLGLGAAALPAAVLYGRSPSRLRGAALVLLLAASLSAHPFVGVVMGVFAAGVIVILAEQPGLAARAKLLVAPATLLVLLVAYFYVPLVFLPQGQSAAKFVDTMPGPVPWGSFVRPQGGPFNYLVSWSPITLLLVAAGIFVVLMQPVRTPSAHFDPWNLEPIPNPTQRLDAFLTELTRANERLRRYRPLALLAGWSWFVSALFVAYCVLQHLTPTFPYYVNGLYPNAMLVYAAVFAVLGSAFALKPIARRGAVPLLLVGALGAGLLGLYLPGRAMNYNNAGRRMMEGMVARNIPNQHIYRIADASPDMALFLNAYTQTPQTDGYQPQGDLHPSWQIWLEDAILGQGQNGAARKFLFDWYSVKWILVHDRTPYTGHRSYYRLVENRPRSVDPTTLWEVRQPTPIFTATRTAPLLFVGDALHYDLFLRALAAANVNSSELIPVEADSLAGYSLAQLRSYRGVVLWGSPVGGHGATLLGQYVRSGGRVFVDEGEAKPLFPANAEPVGPFVVKNIRQTWNWANAEPGSLPSSLLYHLPPPDYAGSNRWQATYPKQLPANAVVLARSHGRVELASVHEGKGVLVWSGINLPYLASSTHSPTATRLLVDLATGVTKPQVVALGGTARRFNPEHWEFTVPAGTKGLLVRQYTSVDWHASNAATGAALPIRSAGPGMTFVPVPPSRTTTTIELKYELSAPEQGGLWLSALGVLILVIYAAGFRWPGRLR